MEVCLAALAVGAAYIAPGWLASGYRRLDSVLTRASRRPGVAVLAIGALALVARAAVLPVLPVPQPRIQDEFSYLLAADTFAHGRMTNPAHPMWVHFESFHIIHNPTYASMYYPGLGLMLAAGEVVFGHPFVGVWLSLGFMCAAICWMLQGWLPGKWAVLGGCIAIVRVAMFSYWADSYFGGTLPAIGGALVLGALPRIQRRRQVRHSLVMAAGLAILANTRPWEGLFFGIPVAAVIIGWMLQKNAPSVRVCIRRIILPISLALVLIVSAMGYYFWRVTGSPFRIPYQVNIQTYGLMYFPWQELKPLPEYHHAVMRDFYEKYSLDPYLKANSNPSDRVIGTLAGFWLFYFGPVLTLPFLVWTVTRPAGVGRFASRKTRFFAAVCLVTLVGIMLPIYGAQPHYGGALLSAFYALLLQAMRHTRFWRWEGKRAGEVIIASVLCICAALVVVRVATPLPCGKLRTWCSEPFGNTDRARVLAELSAYEGGQLAIVRYGPNHDSVFNEWVYNDAGIDQSKVVWAREMSPAEDRELIHYFKDRQVWLVEADEKPARVSPYLQ